MSVRLHGQPGEASQPVCRVVVVAVSDGFSVAHRPNMRKGGVQRNPGVRAVTAVPTEHYNVVSRVEELLRHHLEVGDLSADRLEDLFNDTLATVMLTREGHAG